MVSVMKTSFFDKAKRIISLVIILLLSAVCYGSIDLSCDVFSPGGSIRGSRSTAISQSLIVSTPPAVHEINSRSIGNEQNHKKANSASHTFGRTAKKILQFLDGFWVHDSSYNFRNYFIRICIACYAYLFLLTHVSFIHLKDGSK